MIRQAVKRLLKFRYLDIPAIDDVCKGFRPEAKRIFIFRYENKEYIQIGGVL